jgi:hypothetical protein
MALVSNLQLTFLGHIKSGGVPGASNELSCTIQSVGNLFRDPFRDLPVCGCKSLTASKYADLAMFDDICNYCRALSRIRSQSSHFEHLLNPPPITNTAEIACRRIKTVHARAARMSQGRAETGIRQCSAYT